MTSASVGPKCEAFATPQAFEDPDMILKGSNELSWAEIELVNAYHQLGRPDLADCIKLGRPFQWLSVLSDKNWAEYTYIKALGESLGIEMRQSMEGFLTQQKNKYRTTYKPLERKWRAEDAAEKEAKKSMEAAV
jgi:hypothetical protein